MQVKGFLQRIKTRNTKFGDYYVLVVDGKDHDTGSKFPPKGVSEGDYISFEIVKNAKGYDAMVQGSLSKEAAPAGVAPPAAPIPSAIKMDRQDVISRQAALNSALDMVSILVAGGGIPDGKTQTPAKKAELLEALVMSFTAKFHRYSTGVDYELPEEDVAAVAAASKVDWAEAE